MHPNIMGAKMWIEPVVSIMITTREKVIRNWAVSIAAAATRMGTSAMR